MPESIQLRDRVDLVRSEAPPGELTIGQNLRKGYRSVGLPGSMQPQKDPPELLERLRKIRHVELWGTDAGRLLRLLVMLAQRDPVLVLLGETKDALGVR